MYPGLYCHPVDQRLAFLQVEKIRGKKVADLVQRATELWKELKSKEAVKMAIKKNCDQIQS
jgi:hypothetical protein